MRNPCDRCKDLYEGCIYTCYLHEVWRDIEYHKECWKKLKKESKGLKRRLKKAYKTAEKRKEGK